MFGDLWLPKMLSQILEFTDMEQANKIMKIVKKFGTIIL